MVIIPKVRLACFLAVALLGCRCGQSKAPECTSGDNDVEVSLLQSSFHVERGTYDESADSSSTQGNGENDQGKDFETTANDDGLLAFSSSWHRHHGHHDLYGASRASIPALAYEAGDGKPTADGTSMFSGLFSSGEEDFKYGSLYPDGKQRPPTGSSMSTLALDELKGQPDDTLSELTHDIDVVLDKASGLNTWELEALRKERNESRERPTLSPEEQQHLNWKFNNWTVNVNKAVFTQPVWTHDGLAFLNALLINSLLLIVLLLVYSALRLAYPLVYSANSRRKKTPWETKASFVGWISDSLSLTTEDVIKYKNLDHAMLIEYTNLSQRILLVVGLPTFLVLAPLHDLKGGKLEDTQFMPGGVSDGAFARNAGSGAGKWLFDQSIDNVKRGNTWIFWIHCVVVWYVVAVTLFFVFRAKYSFLQRRKDYLKELPPVQANTILVQNLTNKHTKIWLEDLFNGSLGRGAVHRVYFVKNTPNLTQLWQELKAKQTLLGKANAYYTKHGARPQHPDYSTQVDAITKYTDEVHMLRDRIQLEQKRVSNSEDENHPSAFVTFQSHHHAAEAAHMTLPLPLTTCDAPNPNDVIYDNLKVSTSGRIMFKLLCGFLILLALVLFGFLTLWICAIVRPYTLKGHSPFLKHVYEDKNLDALWTAFVGPMALSQLMGLLPFFYCSFFEWCYSYAAKTSVQHGLQTVYFYSLLWLLLVVTPVGLVLAPEYVRKKEWDKLTQDTKRVGEVFEYNIVMVSHFFLMYYMWQWISSAVSLNRFVHLFKYLFYTTRYEDEVKRGGAISPLHPHELTEVDQDFHGMGSRSARSTLLLITGLVFCSVNPMLTPIVFVNLLLYRLFWGYETVFSENSKADTGGHFFVSQLEQTILGLLVYVLAMVGLLWAKADNHAPALATAVSGSLVIAALMFFRTIHWRRINVPEKDARSMVLPSALQAKEAKWDKEVGLKTYQQPELAFKPQVPEAEVKKQAAGMFSSCRSQSAALFGACATNPCPTNPCATNPCGKAEGQKAEQEQSSTPFALGAFGGSSDEKKDDDNWFSRLPSVSDVSARLPSIGGHKPEENKDASPLLSGFWGSSNGKKDGSAH